MAVNLRIVVLWLVISLCISQSTAFFWWSSSDPSPQDNMRNWPPIYAYHPRYAYHPAHMEPLPATQVQEASEPVPIPRIPIQTPLRAQLAPVPNVHNVQLVPCLCPVSADEYPEQNNKVQATN